MERSSDFEPDERSRRLIALLNKIRAYWDLDGLRDRSKFARKLGFNPSTVFRWEQGGPITDQAVKRIARAIKENPERLQSYLSESLELDDLVLPSLVDVQVSEEPGLSEPPRPANNYETVRRLLPTLKLFELLDLLPKIYTLLRRRLAASLTEQAAAEYSSIAEIVELNWDALIENPYLCDRLPELRDNAAPTEMEILRIGMTLDLDEQYLEDLANQSKQTNGTN